ncbi:TIGR03668 family PPOX class F420-dependent oxidoreductase [Paractinoplanes atraurantiacus]|uniref:PPOX class probable F420-dependent enzyme, Rv0121 family n=1 Tax=Paractinoplanes atraurantiacus TaxID=1036182 RepID=A0A285GJB3_9ACTN|nr:TIGR03668 family PPOX class F420-dependent oxidoreductase [Actinoplanes atraurantiacus]SNY23677.1 PPOX class probable F420-dependent enzyme, Rv0121 family [Actinoplanes atraurantiacus]
MTPAERFAAQPVARLATVGADGAPHLVPIVFALVGDVIVSAVDGKPKRSRALKRLANIAAEPRVSVLADHYENDWQNLWWVRADGVARVRDDAPAGLPQLVAKYAQYQTAVPEGPYIEITVEKWSVWDPARYGA